MYDHGFSHSELAQTAFKYILLYFAVYFISENSNSGERWIIERYYHDFLASNVSKHPYSEEQIRSLPSSLFTWPSDLPSPSITIYLIASVENRSMRSSVFKDDEFISAATVENDAHIACGNIGCGQTSVLDVFSRIQLVHSLVKGPAIIAIDGDSSIMEVQENAYQACELFGISFRRDEKNLSSTLDGEFTLGILSSPEQDIERKQRFSSGRVSLGVYGALSQLPLSPDT